MTIAVAQTKIIGQDTAANLAFDSNVAAGSLIVVAGIMRDGSNTIAAPDGTWTGTTVQHGAGTFDGGCCCLYWKGSGAGGFSSLGTFPATSSVRSCAYCLYEITGANTSAISSQSAGGGSSSSHPVLSAITGSGSGAICIAVLTIADYNSTPYTPDSGYTETFDRRCSAANGEAPGGTSIYKIGSDSSYTPGATSGASAKWCGVGAAFADSAPAALARSQAIIVL